MSFRKQPLRIIACFGALLDKPPPGARSLREVDACALGQTVLSRRLAPNLRPTIALATPTSHANAL
eukprot:8086001-Alexandrium_andersonii.AAC.1